MARMGGVMKVYVIMGNDYPDAVFSSREVAEKFVAEKKKERKDGLTPIYWRSYEFEMDARS